MIFFHVIFSFFFCAFIPQMDLNFIEHLLYTKSNTMFWKSGGGGLPDRRQVLELEQEMPSQAVCLNTGSPTGGA